MKGAILTVCALLLLLAAEVGFISTTSAGEPKQYCVAFDKASRKAVKDAIKVNFGDVIKKEFSLVDVVVLSLPAEDAKKLAEIPGAIRVVPDRARIEFDKGPPPDKGKPKVEGETLPWGVDRIGAGKVWDPDGDLVIDAFGAITGSGIRVAIVDTGIDFEHPDLQVAGGLNTVEGQKLDYPDDEYGHGTMCAGVVAAQDNDVGYIGVAPGVELYAVKLCGAEGELPLSALYTGMEWCIKGPDGSGPPSKPNTGDEMQVISMSFGLKHADGTPMDDPAFHELITLAYNRGIVLVASAGNDGEDLDTTPHYPASYGGVIAVSATGKRGKNDYFAGFSNFGSAIDLAAPGVGVETTANGGGYTTASGTSLSCPHVAATAALVLERFGPQSPGHLYVRDYLGDTADWLDKLTAAQQGAGLADAEAAICVNTPAPPRRRIVSPEGKISAIWGELKRK